MDKLDQSAASPLAFPRWHRYPPKPAQAPVRKLRWGWLLRCAGAALFAWHLPALAFLVGVVWTAVWWNRVSDPTRQRTTQGARPLAFDDAYNAILPTPPSQPSKPVRSQRQRRSCDGLLFGVIVGLCIGVVISDDDE